MSDRDSYIAALQRELAHARVWATGRVRDITAELARMGVRPGAKQRAVRPPTETRIED